MKRKELIIFAVLINLTVLGFLFLISQRGEKGRRSEERSSLYDEWVSLEPSPSHKGKSSNKLSSVAVKDELDQLLEEYGVSEEKSPKEAKAALSEKNDSQKIFELTVKRGDSLDKIARRYKTSVQSLMEENKLASERLSIGQRLLVPLSKETKHQSPEELIKRKISDSKEYYTMKSGDNPWKVAKNFHVPFEELLQLNGLDEEKARNLRPGDILRVK